MRIYKILALLAMAGCCLTINAATYGIDDIPNVQVADRTKLLSNPDGIISPAVGAQIDSLLVDARRQSTAEIAVVVVGDIDTDDIDTFATTLINKWGVGAKDKNNGILIIVAKDGRMATIRTGYGSEGVLPDILAGRIIDNTMIPHFHVGDYDGGVLAAVQQVHELVTQPEAVSELMADIQAEHEARVSAVVHTYLWGGGIAAAAMILWLVFAYNRMLNSTPKPTDYQIYQQLGKYNLPYWIVTLLFIGLPIVAPLALWLLRKYLRNHPRKCPRCGYKMQKQNEVEDNKYLTDMQDLEERIKSVDYDVWLCRHCGEKDIYSFVNKASVYRECPVCHGHTMRLTGTRILREPSYSKEGIGEKQYNCLHCHTNTPERYSIPKKERPITVVPLGGGGRGFGGGGFGGGGFGGGFGGGLSGGGGATGRW